MNSTSYNEMMAELRKEYLDSFDEKFQAMRTYFEGQDWYSLELEFHKLKGTGSTYGVPEVTELCRLMETTCRDRGALAEKQLNDSIELLKNIKDKYEQGQDFELSSDPRYLELQKI